MSIQSLVSVKSLGSAPLRLVRFYSSARQSIVDDLKARGPWFYVQDISPNHVGKLDATLSSHLPNIPPSLAVPKPTKTLQVVPPGYHLIFFNDTSPEAGLSSDGYHGAQAPDESVFPNRMWLGGSVEYNHSAEQLTQGRLGSAIETISNVDYKSKPSSDSSKPPAERIDVTLDRYMFGSNISSQIPETETPSKDTVTSVLDSTPWSIYESRSLAYFSPTAGSSRQDIFSRVIKPKHVAAFQHTVHPKPVTLFRYSALTFNSHLIHYNPVYCQQVEGLPDCLVHGPFSVTTALAWLSKSVLPSLQEQYGKDRDGKELRIKKFSYRNLLPLLVDKPLTLKTTGLKTSTDGKESLEVWIENDKGSVTVSGTLELVWI